MILELTVAALIGAVAVALRYYHSTEQMMTPDGQIYVMMHNPTYSPPNPYRLRWLIPRLIRDISVHRWVRIGQGFTVATFPAMYLFAEAAGAPGLWAVIIWATLPVIDSLVRIPVLIEPYAWTAGLLTGACALNGWTVPAVVLALLGGAIEPRLPLIVAAWTLHPLPLLGLIPLGIVHLLAPKSTATFYDIANPNLDFAGHPWRSGHTTHAPHLFSAPKLLLPWGGLIVGMASVAPTVWLSLGLAYGQLLRATDRTRLFMWAAPALIVAALGLLPASALPLVALACWFNPWRREE